VSCHRLKSTCRVRCGIDVVFADRMEGCGGSDNDKDRHQVREYCARIHVDPLRSVPDAVATSFYDGALLEKLHVWRNRGPNKTYEQENVIRVSM
jgi:hypothetical protein